MAAYDKFTTTRGAYTRHLQPFGPPKFKRDGKFISRNAFNGAQAHVQTRTDRKHIHRDKSLDSDIPRSDPLDLVAIKDSTGRWRAGVNAHLYFDNIQVGQFLGPKAVFNLRSTAWGGQQLRQLLGRQRRTN